MTATGYAYNQTLCPAPDTSWPKTRILFLLAGTVTLIGVVLSATLNPWFLLIPTMVGANQLLMVAVGWCPMSLLFDKFGIGVTGRETQTRADTEASSGGSA